MVGRPGRAPDTIRCPAPRTARHALRRRPAGQTDGRTMPAGAASCSPPTSVKTVSGPRATRPDRRSALSQYSATCSVRTRGTGARCTYSPRATPPAAADRIFVRRPLAARWVGRPAGNNTLNKHHRHYTSATI